MHAHLSLVVTTITSIRTFVQHAASRTMGSQPTFAALAQTAQKGPFVERFIVAADARIIWVFQAN
jgi:hypothetical protein